jgi:hypothetical protein
MGRNCSTPIVVQHLISALGVLSSVTAAALLLRQREIDWQTSSSWPAAILTSQPDATTNYANIRLERLSLISTVVN